MLTPRYRGVTPIAPAGGVRLASEASAGPAPPMIAAHVIATAERMEARRMEARARRECMLGPWAQSANVARRPRPARTAGIISIARAAVHENGGGLILN